MVLQLETNWENSGGAAGREDTSPYVLPTLQNPSCWNPSLLRDARATSKDPESYQTWARVTGQKEPGNESQYHQP